ATGKRHAAHGDIQERVRALCVSVWGAIRSLYSVGRMNVRVPVTLDVAAETARGRHPDAKRRVLFVSLRLSAVAAASHAHVLKAFSRSRARCPSGWAAVLSGCWPRK